MAKKQSALPEEFISKLQEQKKIMTLSRSSTYSQDKAQEVLNKVKENLKLEDRYEALAIVAVLFHLGGTARKCDGNLSVELFGRTTKLAEIRRSLRECGVAKSERKLARSYATEIRDICLQLGIPGNLSTKIQRSNPEFEMFPITEATWLSDFQLENPDCPSELRKLIANTLTKNIVANNKNKIFRTQTPKNREILKR